jgi:hypothetical protein
MRGTEAASTNIAHPSRTPAIAMSAFISSDEIACRAEMLASPTSRAVTTHTADGVLTIAKQLNGR